MTYQATDFGRDLLSELKRGYDVVRISRWAMAIYLKNCSCIDPLLKKEVMKVVSMEEGPEFEMAEEQLREFAHCLMAQVQPGLSH
jgi:hypothetical protein